MKVTVDGVEYEADGVLVSEAAVHVFFPLGSTRVPPKSEMVHGWTDVGVSRGSPGQ